MPSEPVPPRPAATVVLLRDRPGPPPGRSALQVFLQRRVAGMAFAGGMTVFPGGGVDVADVPDPQRWTGPDPSWWADRLGCTTSEAGALVLAAVRETFEECGVLLAAPRRAGGRARLDPDLLAGTRAELVAHRRTLTELLRDAELTLRADLLRPWARWITPVDQPRRYDTAFFVAVVPAGQEADAHTTEAVEATWWHPDEALTHGDRGEIRLMAPTRRTLQEIGEHDGTAAVLAAAEHRDLRAITPRLVQRGGTATALLPGDVEIAAGHLPPGDRPPGDRP